jgi:mevalonate kinase
MGSGLGSSAALCVALSGALLAFSDSASLDLSHQGWLAFRESELDLLNKWAFEGEKILHGRPSGVDNTVSTYGMLFCDQCQTNQSSIINVPFLLLFSSSCLGFSSYIGLGMS